MKTIDIELIFSRWYTGNMHSQNLCGYREISHTADWELEIWAPDLGTLLEQAARGMYHLAEARLAKDERLTRWFELPIHEPEILLVDFLTELMFFTETEGLGFDEYELQLEGNILFAQVTGATLESLSKEIKAITFHNLNIRASARGLEVNIVFDV